MAEEVDETKRKSRNLSEKKRRDQFNMLVNELSSMVTTNGRKMDKSTVLKSAITFLKNHNETTVRSRIHDIQEEWKPPFLSNVEFTRLILDALDGFIVVFSATGHINFVSESVTSLLGYLPSDIMNKSIFDLAYDEDRPSLYSLLQNPGTSVDSVQAVVLKENQIEFQCHIRRGSLDYREEPTYELVHFIGYFRSNVEQLDVEGISSPPQNRDSKLLFVCTGRLKLPQLIRDMSPSETEQCEFTSRHSLEWKYLFLDHRAPAIIGYLPFEVLGTSGYDYYHLDDLEKVATCHEALMEKGELTSCYYRFLTKGQQWIWLQTRFYITYHQWNSKPEFVVCTHRVVSYADVMIKSEAADSVDNPGAGNFSTLGDAVTEADVSMGDVSPSYVSESSDDYDRHLMSHAGSVQSMSTGSAGGSGADGSAGPSSARAGDMAASAPSSNTSQVSQYQGSSWTRAARLRYGSSESGSTPSGSVCARRRQAHDPVRGSGSDNISGCQYLEAVRAPAYAVSVPLVVSPVQVQIQDQLQRKHEELQQLIVLQQEELRRIAEQLVMARLGMLPQVQYGENVVMNGGPPQIMYEVPASYALPPPALHQPMLPPSALPAILPASVLPPPPYPPAAAPDPPGPAAAHPLQHPPGKPHSYRRHMPQ